MARTSAKAKKQKKDVNKPKTEITDSNESEKQEVKPVNDSEDTNGSTDKENDNSNYEVEKIVHTRIYHGKRQYLVRWKGYKEDSDTWENESILQSCSDALEVFQKENPKLIEKSQNDSDNEGEETQESEEEKEKKKTKKGTKKVATKKTKTTNKSKIVKEPLATLDSEDENLDKNDLDDNNEKVKTKDGKGTKKVSKRSKQEIEEPVSKKRKSENSDTDDNIISDGKNYEVEKILEVHTRKNGTREFLIRWKGYRPSDDTWEPEAHLDCSDLIEKFMEKVDKAKNCPMRELREPRTPKKRFITTTRVKGRANLRNSGVRPCYQE